MALKFLNEETGDLKDVVFCFTGKSPKPRDQMVDIAILSGAAVTLSITKSTTILVIADANSTSSKAEKARSLGLDLISPEQFFEICDFPNHNKGIFHLDSTIEIHKPEPIKENSNEVRRHSFVRRIQL
jgi:BRCT domain type II-containing protein